MEGLLFGAPATEYPRTRAEIDAYPYAQLGVLYDGGRPGIAVLAEYVNGNHLWIASDKFSLLTSPTGRVINLQVNGRFWRSADFASDPISTVVDTWGDRVFSYVREVEIGDVNSVSDPLAVLELDCTLTASPGRESLHIKKQEVVTRRWDERCSSAQGDKSTFSIWVDDKRRMWRAEGEIAPNAKPLRLDILKVPA